MHASKASISIHHDRLHTNLPEAILSAFHTPALQAHIFERTGWSKLIFDTVDWDLLDTYMSTLNDSYRTNAVKFFYDWQNTGSQNLKFKESECDKPISYRTYNKVHTTCLFQCGDLEKTLHYMCCDNPLAC